MTRKKRQAQSVLAVFGNAEPLRYSRRKRISQKVGSDCELLWARLQANRRAERAFL